MGINWRDGGFHLTVNADGLTSLWDNKNAAKSVKGETYVFMPLTVEQTMMLMNAASAAKTSKEGNGF